MMLDETSELYGQQGVLMGVAWDIDCASGNSKHHAMYLVLLLKGIVLLMLSQDMSKSRFVSNVK
jgi:hypothetical protein